jgi:hypothetical protein
MRVGLGKVEVGDGVRDGGVRDERAIAEGDDGGRSNSMAQLWKRIA